MGSGTHPTRPDREVPSDLISRPVPAVEEGWWQASDGEWYPPETHPDRGEVPDFTHRSEPAAEEGWWQATDGEWYPPETHPDRAGGTGLHPSEPVPAAEEGWWQAL